MTVNIDHMSQHPQQKKIEKKKKQRNKKEERKKIGINVSAADVFMNMYREYSMRVL